jgi:hypothetical protein
MFLLLTGVIATSFFRRVILVRRLRVSYLKKVSRAYKDMKEEQILLSRQIKSRTKKKNIGFFFQGFDSITSIRQEKFCLLHSGNFATQ